MAARVGMANLIKMLRGLANAGTADVTVAGVTYWSDDQLQDALDRTRTVVARGLLDLAPTYEDGAWVYREYIIPREFGKHFEEAGADSGWAVRNASGGTVTGYDVNYAARRITFSADQEGADYWLDARAYDMYAAAADVWEQKAGHVAQEIDWASDNHDVKASQKHAQYMAMAKQYRRMAGPKTSRFVRIDEA